MRNDAVTVTDLHKNMIEAHCALLYPVDVAFVSVETSAFIEDGLNHQLHPVIQMVFCSSSEQVMESNNSL